MVDLFFWCHFQAEKERGDLDAKVKALTRANDSLEDRVRQHVLSLSAANEETAAQKATATQMRYVLFYTSVASNVNVHDWVTGWFQSCHQWKD